MRFLTFLNGWLDGRIKAKHPEAYALIKEVDAIREAKPARHWVGQRMGDTVIRKNKDFYLANKEFYDENGERIMQESKGKKHDAGKPMMGLIPGEAELELAKVLTFGAEKYGADNWREVPNAKVRYTSAMHRHLNAVKRGEVLDDESGLSHLGHAAACLMFLLEMEMEAKDKGIEDIPFM